jgi:dephospho-CoA kinase
MIELNIIGMTGGIGSGKTQVSLFFAELGISVVDTDQISRELVKSGSSNLQEIVAFFGSDILLTNGELNRSKLRQIIFSKPDKKQWLEALLHPQIRKLAWQQLAACHSSYAILVVPLLIESQHYDFVDRILVVDCEEDLQIERVMQRDQNDRSVAKGIISSQLTRKQRLSQADDVIENNGTLAELKDKVRQLHEYYQELAKLRD